MGTPPQHGAATNNPKLEQAYKLLDAYIDREMKIQHVPGISVAITDRNGLMRISNYGFADMKTRALDFTDGVLSVQVPDANWRTQLLGLAPQYLAEVNKFVTKNVRKIAFVIAEDSSTPQRAKAVTHT